MSSNEIRNARLALEAALQALSPPKPEPKPEPKPIPFQLNFVVVQLHRPNDPQLIEVTSPDHAVETAIDLAEALRVTFRPHMPHYDTSEYAELWDKVPFVDTWFPHLGELDDNWDDASLAQLQNRYERARAPIAKASK